MGLASSCQTFERFSCALQWIVQKMLAESHVSHILDDFIFVGPMNMHNCNEQLQYFLEVCSAISLPVKHSKTVHPATSIEVHGFLLNTLTMQVSLPTDNIDKAIALLTQFACNKKQRCCKNYCNP